MSVSALTNASFADIADVLRTRDNFVICGHVSPDGDCIGSQLALHHALQRAGKHSVCVLVKEEPLPASLLWLPGADEMQAAERCQAACEVFIAVDVPNRERIGAAVQFLDAAAFSISIDHHEADKRLCDLAYIDTDAASTSVLIWDVIKLLSQMPPYESAICVYTGLLTDTGSFCFQNTNKAALQCAIELLERGVDPAFIATKVLQNRSLASILLEKDLIEHMTLFANNQAVISWISADDMKRYNACKTDIDPLIDVLRSLSSPRIVCLLREYGSSVRGNLRAKDDSDVSAIAREFGGGGHRAASGFSLNASLSQAREIVMQKIQDVLDGED